MSKKKKIIYVLLALLTAVLVFHAGMFIIGMKTDYLERWAGHQYFGEIVKIDGENFSIRNQGDSQREVRITEKTVFKKGPDTVDNNLRPGDRVIVFGRLDGGGKIEAELIRIFDPNDRTKWQKLFLPPFQRQ